jgi:hypothetical protein
MCYTAGRWPVFGADLLSDHRLIMPLSTSGTSAQQSGEETTVTAAEHAGAAAESGGYSIEALLANVQGLLKAVVDGARHREHQADIERGLKISVLDSFLLPRSAIS